MTDARSTERLEVALRAANDPAELTHAARMALAERADREGLADVAIATADSPFGELLLAATPRGLVRIALPTVDRDAALAELAARVSPRLVELPRRLDRARRELDEYFGGARHEFDLDLDRRLSGEGFAARAQRGIESVPFGEVITYAELATRAGNPRAHRAAGSACGRNPIPIVVPCHRIVRSGGGIGHYAGGPEMKRELLRRESAGR
ncbi:methylated-DNA--[protein]-cysteine S-methyltransferase [Thermoleophilia bacterium SCSIO 60948]|nr:methylated-DNA--[protein]-cysteine S-methyltransferase [Thermoleophilia bacterium SCSIO 60948]